MHSETLQRDYICINTEDFPALRPVLDRDPADVGRRHEGLRPDARVGRFQQVVADDEVVAVRDAPGAYTRPGNPRPVVPWAVVDIQAPGFEFDDITRPGGDPLDIQCARHGRSEHDHVADGDAPTRWARQQYLAGVQRRLHRTAVDAYEGDPACHVSGGCRASDGRELRRWPDGRLGRVQRGRAGGPRPRHT